MGRSIVELQQIIADAKAAIAKAHSLTPFKKPELDGVELPFIQNAELLDKPLIPLTAKKLLNIDTSLAQAYEQLPNKLYKILSAHLKPHGIDLPKPSDKSVNDSLNALFIATERCIRSKNQDYTDQLTSLLASAAY